MFENIVTGVILTSICVMGFLGNSATLLILNSTQQMRNQPINIYLTVLALFDNGVLFNAVLMLGVPGIYKLMHEQRRDQSYDGYDDEDVRHLEADLLSADGSFRVSGTDRSVLRSGLLHPDLQRALAAIARSNSSDDSAPGSEPLSSLLSLSSPPLRPHPPSSPLSQSLTLPPLLQSSPFSSKSASMSSLFSSAITGLSITTQVPDVDRMSGRTFASSSTEPLFRTDVRTESTLHRSGRRPLFHLSSSALPHVSLSSPAASSSKASSSPFASESRLLSFTSRWRPSGRRKRGVAVDGDTVSFLPSHPPLVTSPALHSEHWSQQSQSSSGVRRSAGHSTDPQHQNPELSPTGASLSPSPSASSTSSSTFSPTLSAAVDVQTHAEQVVTETYSQKGSSHSVNQRLTMPPPHPLSSVISSNASEFNFFPPSPLPTSGLSSASRTSHQSNVVLSFSSPASSSSPASTISITNDGISRSTASQMEISDTWMLESRSSSGQTHQRGEKGRDSLLAKSRISDESDHFVGDEDGMFDTETEEGDIPLRNSSSSPPIDPLYLYIQFVYPLALISQTGSIWTTCLITAERYFAIAHPLRALTLSTRKRATWALITMSIMAVLYNLPRFAEVEIVGETEDSVVKNVIRASPLRRNRVYIWVYYICLYLTLMYIIPLTLLSVLNTKIYLAIKRANRDRSSLTQNQESEMNIATMLVALVAIFIGCNAPAFAVNCLELVNNSPYFDVAMIFSNFLVCFNSSINFVIYCTFGKKFRERLRDMFCCSDGRLPRRATPIRNRKTSIVAETLV